MIIRIGCSWNKFIVLCVILMLTLVGCSKKSGVVVSVKNESGGNIRNLKVSYVGGQLEKEILNNLDVFSGNANPTSESHLVVEFEDDKGHKVRKELDVYFERNYRRTILVTVTPNLNIEVKKEISL